MPGKNDGTQHDRILRRRFRSRVRRDMTTSHVIPGAGDLTHLTQFQRWVQKKGVFNGHRSDHICFLRFIALYVYGATSLSWWYSANSPALVPALVPSPKTFLCIQCGQCPESIVKLIDLRSDVTPPKPFDVKPSLHIIYDEPL